MTSQQLHYLQQLFLEKMALVYSVLVNSFLSVETRSYRCLNVTHECKNIVYIYTHTHIIHMNCSKRMHSSV